MRLGHQRLPRPTVLTSEVRRLMTEALARCEYVAKACKLAGITPATYYRQRSRWLDGKPGAEQHAEFFEAVELASIHGELQGLTRVRAGGENWTEAARYLERRFPGRWGRPAKRTSRAVQAEAGPSRKEIVNASMEGDICDTIKKGAEPMPVEAAFKGRNQGSRAA
jgi:hypothetical protein